MAESFYVLLGTVKIFDGRVWLDAGPGDFVHVPPGGLHGFRNDSDARASMLIHFAPGAPREAYFEGLARWATEGRPSQEASRRSTGSTTTCSSNPAPRGTPAKRVPLVLTAPDDQSDGERASILRQR